MSTTITMQLNATDVAGDWATRSAGTARTATGVHGDVAIRGAAERHTDELAVYMADLRGAVEAIRRGAVSPTIADSRTDAVELGFGTPAMYCGMRFALDFA